MDAHLRAGIAIYNEGHHHAAHDAWEQRWLAVKSDPDRRDDERLLHGLIQFTAAIYHGEAGNREGLRGLARSAVEYLGVLPPAYRGVNVGEVREYLRSVADAPERLEREDPPPLTLEGDALRFADLDFEAVAIVAAVLAAESERDDEGPAYDVRVIERAAAAARESIQEGGTNEFVALLFDFVADDEHRPTIHRRLREHVERRQREIDDVDGLFEE